MANSDIIKIGFDYRASLAQFEKDTNGVFDGISTKAGKQKITIQLDAKDDKVIDKIKELQKLKLDKFTFEFGSSGLKEQLQTFDKLENKINEIINLGKGRSFIDSSSTVSDIGKIENKINELNKKYEETQKKLSSIGSGNVSGKDINLVDNAEFQKLSDSFEKIKGEVDDLKTHMNLLDDSVVSGEQFIKLGEQVEGLSVKFDTLIDKYVELSNVQRALSSTPQESNISTEVSAAQQQEKIQNKVTQTIQEQNKAIDETIKKTLTLNDVRQKQWEIIQKTNPKEKGTNSTWVDKPEDAKTFYEVNHKDSDYPFNENYSDDWTVKDKMNVEATGKITVYSSYPIEDGNWVTPSKEEGLSYAGSGKLYSATMDPRDIAWVDAGQGQVAHISDELKEVIDLSTEAEMQVQSIDNKTNETSNQSTLSTLDDTIAKYETIVSLVKEYYDLSNNKKDTIGMSSDDERISEIRKQLKSYTQNPDYDGKYKMGFGGSGKNIFAKSVDLSQEEMLQEICNMLGVEIPKNADKAKEAIKEVASATASTDQMKDAFPKTSENLEQVAQSEQKVQQEAVATDKALDNISFTPNTEGFDDIIAKFGILREQAEQITKIVKTTKQTADGTPDISYKATLRNGSSYYLGENSTPQVLNASETVYDSNAIEKAYQEATKVNNALNETNSLLNSLKIPNGFEGSFSTLESEIKRLNSEFGLGKISATEYASSIKKAFSDYKTPIDDKAKETWNDLTTSLDRYAILQKRIASNNALSTDVEEAKNLKSHIDDLKESDILPKDKLNIVDEKLQQINQTVTDLKAKLKESTLDSLQGSIDKYQKIYDQRKTYSSDFTPSEQYTKNLTGLDTAIGNLVEYKNALKNVGEVTVEQETHLKELVAACEKASDSFKSLSASEKGASQIAVDKLVQRINKDLDKNTNYSKQAKQGLRALRDELESANPRNLKDITSEIINIENAEIRAGRAGRSFIDTLKNSGFHQIAAQMAGMFGVYDVINLGKEGFNVVRELNTALTEMRKVSDETVQSLKNYQATTFDTADAVGTTAKQIQTSTADYMRLGESIDEAAESAKTANVLLNVSEFDNIEDATKSLVAMGQAYKDLDKMTIVDKLNEVGASRNVW